MGSNDPPKPPSFAEENAMRVASESISYYDADTDTYHCSYGPPAPALSIRDARRQLLVRVDPHSRAVVGFSIPNFRAWHAEHAEEDGGFEVDLPPTWPIGDAEDRSGTDSTAE